MALSETRTITERVKTLRAFSATVQSLIKQCSDVDTYWNSTSDFAAKIEGVPDRMASIQSAAQELADEVDYFASNANMQYQFVWEIGKNGIEQILFGDGDGTGSTDTIRFQNSDGVVLAATVTGALTTGDRIRVSGTASNDGVYLVDSATSGYTNIIALAAASLTAETCSTSGAKVTKTHDEA